MEPSAERKDYNEKVNRHQEKALVSHLKAATEVIIYRDTIRRLLVMGAVEPVALQMASEAAIHLGNYNQLIEPTLEAGYDAGRMRDAILSCLPVVRDEINQMIQASQKSGEDK